MQRPWVLFLGVLWVLVILECSSVESLSGGLSDQCSDDDDQSEHKTVAVKVVRGRLGNHLVGYFQALAMSLAFPVKVLITRETKNVLEQYFKHVRLDVVEDAACGWDRHLPAFLAYVDDKVVSWLEARVGQKIKLRRGADGRIVLPRSLALQFPVDTNDLLLEDQGFFTRYQPNLGEDYNCPYRWELFQEELQQLAEPKWRVGKHLHLFPAGNMGNFTVLYRWPGAIDTFLEDMQFQEKYTTSAKKKLIKIRSEHLNRLNKRKKKVKGKAAGELIFVGIHCRRTDHLAFDEKRGEAPLKTTYFLDAMHAFRKKFGLGNVAFVFVSDDMQWGKNKLMMRNKERDLYLAGDGRPDSVKAVGSDLALLAACNHTIQSRGSFSYFAGALAGGLSIIPEHFAEYRQASARGLARLATDPLDPASALPRFFILDELRNSPQQEQSQRNEL